MAPPLPVSDTGQTIGKRPGAIQSIYRINKQNHVQNHNVRWLFRMLLVRLWILVFLTLPIGCKNEPPN
jgi:hypothetical protein